MDWRLFLMACALVGAAAAARPAATDAAPIRIVAAENVYGDVTAQTGGEDVTVADLT
jgi:ABC-type Zn uptake system ZnuABC Zn-binding protein ZnuA